MFLRNLEPPFGMNLKTLTQNFMPYGDLNPVFVGLDDPDVARQWDALKECRAPTVCEGNFHVEYEEPPPGVDAGSSGGGGEEEGESAAWMSANCTGSISLFTKSEFRGEQLNSEQSLNQGGKFNSSPGQG